MIQTIRKAWGIPELRKKIIFTLLILLIFRIGNAITVPDFFSNRFHDSKHILMTIAAIINLLYFRIYTGSCFVTCGKLIATLFGWD